MTYNVSSETLNPTTIPYAVRPLNCLFVGRLMFLIVTVIDKYFSCSRHVNTSFCYCLSSFTSVDLLVELSSGLSFYHETSLCFVCKVWYSLHYY